MLNMAINLGNAEDIKLVELPEDMQNDSITLYVKYG